MADDTALDSPEKDGFSSGESINWFYETSDGSVFSLTLSPNNNFAINAISNIVSASIIEIDCGGGDDTSNGDQCPPLDFDFVNTGSNMTLFITPPGASDLAALGNGTIGVYYDNNDGQQLCGGSSPFSGSQVQITAMADDSTSPEKDGFSAGEAIIWKFEDNNGNQFDLTPSPQDGFALNGISFISGISFNEICAIDIEVVTGCTDTLYLEYNAVATDDDGSCSTLAVYGCTDANAENYNPDANIADGSCKYNLLGDVCQVSFETVTPTAETNHTIMIPDSVLTSISSEDQIGVFFIADNDSVICSSTSIWIGDTLQIVVLGDDSTTPELDGLEEGSPLLFLAQLGNDVYSVNATFETPAMANYAADGLSFVTGFDFELACTIENLGLY